MANTTKAEQAKVNELAEVVQALAEQASEHRKSDEPTIEARYNLALKIVWAELEKISETCGECRGRGWQRTPEAMTRCKPCAGCGRIPKGGR